MSTTITLIHIVSFIENQNYHVLNSGVSEQWQQNVLRFEINKVIVFLDIQIQLFYRKLDQQHTVLNLLDLDLRKSGILYQSHLEKLQLLINSNQT